MTQTAKKVEKVDTLTNPKITIHGATKVLRYSKVLSENCDAKCVTWEFRWIGAGGEARNMIVDTFTNVANDLKVIECEKAKWMLDDDDEDAL